MFGGEHREVLLQVTGHLAHVLQLGHEQPGVGHQPMGRPLAARAFCSIGVPATARASFYVYNTEEEVDVLVEALAKRHPNVIGVNGQFPSVEYLVRLIDAVGPRGVKVYAGGHWQRGSRVAGLIRADHGYWGAQLLEPYVDEEVSWAIRYHQALRFYPDESVGYGYPELYVKLFGEGYRPEPYIERAYEFAKNHKYYMSARMICVNDLYSFDPNVVVTLEQFDDIIGRHFKTPKEGLGNDNTPSSHMWRSIIWPNNFL